MCLLGPVPAPSEEGGEVCLLGPVPAPSEEGGDSLLGKLKHGKQLAEGLEQNASTPWVATWVQGWLQPMPREA